MPANDEEDLDERTRRQYLAVLQYLQAKGLLETAAQMELETGLSYSEGNLPSAGVLEASLDMFDDYRKGEEKAAAADPVEEELSQRERGICCTGSPAGAGEAAVGANVTAVCWACACPSERLALAASEDRKIRLLDAQGDVLVELAGLSSPPLGLAVCPASEAAVQAAGGQEILATTMGGEALLLWLSRPADGGEEGWALEVRQKLPGHTKHCTSGRFAPLREGASASAHFVTVSRDRQARLYARTSDKPGSEFKLAGTVQLQGEVTSCCWASAETFVLAARDDHNLRYYDVDAEGGEPRERLKTNLNALGDNVVSFCVLALAMSPDGNFIAACTDKSRVILLRAFTGRQLRNLYGAQVDEYDVPSICFSHDGTFLYASSSLTYKSSRQLGDEDESTKDEPSPSVAEAMCGEVTVFELASGEARLRLRCHDKAVRCMDRHPIEEALVTGSFDKTVKFWE